MTLVAVGDSIVHAEDSWAAWLARAMGQPLRRVSANGARSDDVLEQLPGLAGERYAVACLSVGTNDVLFAWDAEACREPGSAGSWRWPARAPTGWWCPRSALSLAGFPGGGAAVPAPGRGGEHRAGGQRRTR